MVHSSLPHGVAPFDHPDRHPTRRWLEHQDSRRAKTKSPIHLLISILLPQPADVITGWCGYLVGTEDFGLLTTVITSRGVPSAYSCHTGSTLVLYRDMLYFFFFLSLIEDLNRAVTTRTVYSCFCYTIATETQSQSLGTFR